MQIKTVSRVVREKMEDWLSTISDVDLRKDVRKTLMVSGGSICNLLMGVPVNDYDVYFQDMNILKRLVQYYLRGMNFDIWDGRNKDIVGENLIKRGEVDGKEYLENGCSMLCSAYRNLKPEQIMIYLGHGSDMTGGKTFEVVEGKGKYQLVHLSPNAISLSDDVQLVLRFTGTPEEIHANYDYVHATNFFTFKNGLIRNQAALESILTKRLVYQGSKYPVTSIIRAKKFLARGFKISAGEYLKMCMQVSALDLTNMDILTDQILAVDAQVFSIVLGILQSKKEKDPTWQPTVSYLNEIINRVFNEEFEEGGVDA